MGLTQTVRGGCVSGRVNHKTKCHLRVHEFTLPCESRTNFYFWLQVTLRADNTCKYVSWRRKKLYLLFAKHRYIAKIFALLVRNDIAEKLYSLNDKAFDSHGFRYDLRLPSFCHVPMPELEKTDAPAPVPEHTTEITPSETAPWTYAAGSYVAGAVLMKRNKLLTLNCLNELNAGVRTGLVSPYCLPAKSYHSA